MNLLCYFIAWALVGLILPVSAQRELKDIPPPAPGVEKASFKVADGFEVNLWAADPLLAKPSQIAFDRKGRLWVASSETYPQLNVNQEPSDRILILEDSDKDGQADKSSVYYDQLVIPGGVLPDGNGGAYVAHGEELLHLHDRNGDGKADQREVLLSGFGSEDTHHTLHRLRWGPGGLLYMLQGYYIGSHVETLYGPRRLNGGGLWSYDIKTRRLEIYSRGLINPWGMIFDRWGQSFQTDGAGGQGINYTFPDSVFRASPNEPRSLNGLNPGRPKSCGLEVISGNHFPPAWRGNLLTCDFRANNIDRYVISSDQSGYKSVLQPDLLSSSHLSFRPIDIVMGPDGAAYVADWYSPIIQHGEVDFRDKRRDRVHGRIWRITAKDRPLVSSIDYASKSIPQVMDLLRHDADWVRLNARQELKKRDEAEVTASLEAWLHSLDRSDPAYEHHRLEALWTYQTIATRRSPSLAHEVLKSPDPRVRAAAIRVLYHWGGTPHTLAEAITDSDPRVRREALTALGQCASPEALVVALGVLNQPMDSYLDFALWRTCRLLEPYWLPAFQRGDLKPGDNAEHLGYALKAIEKPEALAPLMEMIVSGKADETIIRLVGKIGSSAELNTVLHLANRGNHSLTKAATLALAEAAEDRGISPSDQSLLSPVCQRLLKENDVEIVAVACRLAAAWNLKSLRQAIRARLLAAPPLLAPHAANALAKLSDVEALLPIASQGTSRHIRIAATAAIVIIDPAVASPHIAKLLQASLSQAEVETLMAGILRRPGGSRHLANALSRKEIDQENAIHATRLLEVSDREHPELADKLAQAGRLAPMLPALSSSDRDTLLSMIADGKVVRGRAIYERAALACNVCHRVDGEGGLVGPDLSSIGASAPADYLLDSLLNPSAKIKEGYRMSIVTLKNQNVISGAITRETRNALVIRSAFGKETRIPKMEIASRRISPVSMMPGGLVAGLREDELVDLLAYLSSLGRVVNK